MDKNKCTSCGEAPKCSCRNKDFTKAVVEINNPGDITLIRKVVVPASMGDDTAFPPVIGKYHNVLLNYEIRNKSYLYSSDGIPTLLNNGVTDYEEAINLPQINGVTLLGDKSSADLKLADAPMVITVASDNTSWSGADTAEDVYNFFLNKGKVNIVFNGGENYAYEIASAAYISEEEKMLCTLSVATVATEGGTTDFDGNALFGIMTLYTADKAIDVSQIELQPKLFVTDFTGLDLNYNELSGVPATNAAIGMVKPGDGLEVDADGTLSISEIEQYARFFDTVADMKASTDLANGDYARTLGYYAIGDGGGATYKIKDTGTPNEMDIIAIGDTLVAELMMNDEANIKQLGAKGDNSADTSSAFNLAVSTGLPLVIPKGEYKLDSSITIDGDQNIYGEDSVINYTGNDYAFVINTTLKKIVKFGTINSSNGGCLEFYATTSASGDFSQYVDVYFKEFKCKTNGIYAEETGQGSWVNEIRIFNGRLSSYQEGGDYQGTGIKLVHNYNGADKINGWRFYNIGFEGLDTGVHCISTQGQLNKLIFVGCRHSEAFTTLFKTEGQVNTVLFITADGVDISKFTLSNDTSTFKLIGKAYDPNTGQYYGYGAEYNYGNWRYDNAGPIAANTDLNNLKQEGSYFCRDDAIKNTLTNLPQEVLDAQYLSFILIVKQITSSNTSTGRRCIQILITNTSMYFRLTYADNQWNNWKLNINSLTKASGNTNMTSYLPNASAYGCAVDTLGGIACWRFERVTFSSVPSNQPANTIPSGLRPLRLYALPLFNTDTNVADASIVIKADGSIEFNNITTTGKYYGTLTYFLK